jgi:di/tricarboxylate transporter
MNYDIIWVILIMIGATALFITRIFSVEVTSMLVLASLMALKLVTPEEAVSGFSNPATVTVASMFVLSYALKRTGFLNTLGSKLATLQISSKGLLLLLTLVVGSFSAFINNTGIIAIFIPVVAVLALQKKIPLSRWLIPISYAAQTGGVCTLIGTSTNLLVNSIYTQYGYYPISLFEMGQLGVLLLVLVILYFLLFGSKLLPDREGEELVDTFEIKNYITEFGLLENSPLIDKKITETPLSEKQGIRILKILRQGKELLDWKNEPLKKGDLLLIEANLKEVESLKSLYKLEMPANFMLNDATFTGDDLFLTQVVIAPRSSLIGKTLQTVWFQDRYHLVVIAIRRQLGTIWSKLNKTRLQFGDALLVQGSKSAILRLKQDDDFIVVQEAETPPLEASKFFIPFAVIVTVVTVAAMGIAPIMVAAVVGAVTLLVTRCVRASDAYKAIDWSVIFLLAGMIPLSIAITKTGAAKAIASGILHLGEGSDPRIALALLYALCAILTEFMSNNATASLLTPIAISTALLLQVDPKPFVMAVAFAASTSFSTPVGYQTNAMIFTPGGYKYSDFLRTGIPLNLLFFIVSVYLIPKIWPF